MKIKELINQVAKYGLNLLSKIQKKDMHEYLQLIYRIDNIPIASFLAFRNKERFAYSGPEGETMATQSVSAGNKTPLTVTMRYSSSARLEFLLTLISR